MLISLTSPERSYWSKITDATFKEVSENLCLNTYKNLLVKTIFTKSEKHKDVIYNNLLGTKGIYEKDN